MRRVLFAIATAILAWAGAARAQQSPSNLYLLNCWGCHGSRGEGIKGTAPPLIALGDFLKAKGGRSYIIQVPGVSQSALNDAQVAAVMNWVLASMSKGHMPDGFSPYAADEVHRYRATRLDDLFKTRKEIIDKLIAMKVRQAED